jgi:hypothetical protein
MRRFEFYVEVVVVAGLTLLGTVQMLLTLWRNLWAML